LDSLSFGVFETMSGHSHFATIRRTKEVKDAARGKVFTRHAKAITIAIKSGGNADPDMNSRLRFAIDQAKADNMPKTNIDRILEKASESGNLDEITYEGFGPGGIMVLVETATDNRNRTAQEMKGLFDKNGGNMAGVGAVSFNFDLKGLLAVGKKGDIDEQELTLIDLGADDIIVGDTLEVYTQPDQLTEIKKKIEESGFTVTSFSLVQKPKTFQEVTDKETAEKVMKFLDAVENYEDVQNVYSNVEIPEDLEF
jgi:YebC/PmpR family DNA-binding regulatory protein